MVIAPGYRGLSRVQRIGDSRVNMQGPIGSGIGVRNPLN
jgi:hypothetical protein